MSALEHIHTLGILGNSIYKLSENVYMVSKEADEPCWVNVKSMQLYNTDNERNNKIIFDEPVDGYVNVMKTHTGSILFVHDTNKNTMTLIDINKLRTIDIVRNVYAIHSNDSESFARGGILDFYMWSRYESYKTLINGIGMNESNSIKEYIEHNSTYIDLYEHEISVYTEYILETRKKLVKKITLKVYDKEDSEMNNDFPCEAYAWEV